MKKDCPKHGHFEDVMSTDPAFFRRLEALYPGRDFVIPKDGLHEHGTSSIKYGRGAVLTIDLTNRCNMMCNPCFMDANQVGYVHELEWDEVQKILDDAASIKPRRQLSVQFSGGEPTLSPHFLRRDPLRAEARLLLRPVRDERHPLRAGRGLRAGRPRRRACAWRTSSSTASATSTTSTARSATSTT